MSVVLVTPGTYDVIARTVSALREQSAAHHLELVIVAPDVTAVAVPDVDRFVFASVRLVETGRGRHLAAAQAAGVRAATAQVIAFAEDHAVPQPGWASALMEAHRGPWTAVGPAMRNANPDTMTSWADFLLGYGRWREPAPAGPTRHVPGHNSSYKRTALIGFGTRLAQWLDAPALLHANLAAQGRELYLEPEAVVAHTNFSSLRLWLTIRFHAGRAFAAARSADWSLRKRMVYALATPAVPFVRFSRIAIESYRGAQSAGLLLRVAPLLWCGLVIDAIGELTSYLGALPATREREWNWEFHPERRA